MNDVSTEDLYAQGVRAGYFRRMEQEFAYTKGFLKKGFFDTRDYRDPSELPKFNIIVRPGSITVISKYQPHPILLPYVEGFYRTFVAPHVEFAVR